ncbi:MAG: transcriptional regulator, partial [bacterium]|nr:transcriptional regulator [bacterium]
MPATQRALELIDHAGVLRPRDLEPHGIPRAALQRLLQRGEVERVGRGLYMLPGADVTEHHSLVEACKRFPQGVVCLLSALRFHDLTTQNPFEVWLAIPQRAWRPRNPGVALRFVYLSRNAYEAGIEEHRIEGADVRVYSAARTVADCFKFRNKIGLDVALEALKDYRRTNRTGLDDLWRFAKI